MGKQNDYEERKLLEQMKGQAFKQPEVTPPDPRPVFKTFNPIADLVAVRVHRVDRTKDGLILPDDVLDPNENPTATVIAVGPDCKWVKEGDIIVCGNQTPGYKCCHGGSGMVMILKEQTILGVSIVDKAFVRGA